MTEPCNYPIRYVAILENHCNTPLSLFRQRSRARCRVLAYRKRATNRSVNARIVERTSNHLCLIRYTVAGPSICFILPWLQTVWTNIIYAGWNPAYLFEVVFVKCVCIWGTSVFLQFYGVLSGVIYNYSPPLLHYYYYSKSHFCSWELCYW